MNNNEINQRFLTFSLITGFLIITFTSAILITKNFFVNDKNTVSVKHDVEIIKAILKKEIIKPRGRFSSFFIPGNKPVFEDIKDYQSSYDSFSDDENLFYRDLTGKIKFIDLSLKKRNSLPLIYDESSLFIFYPVNYIKATNNQELYNNLGNAFLTKGNEDLKKTNLKGAKKILNYLYIELDNDKKVIVLISAPLDPDPLYPNNKRKVIIIGLQKKSGEINSYKSYIDKLVINNDK